MSPAATIYLVTNTVNGHRYIGVTRFSVQKRWQEHRANAARGLDTRLSSALRKYGADAFTIEAVASCLTLADAGGVERALIQQIRPVYNQTNGGEITSGRRVAPDVAERIRASNLGKTRTAEQNAANSASKRAHHALNGSFHAASLEALARGRSNPIVQQRRVDAVAAAARGRKWSPESRSKLSASRMGMRHDAATIARISAKRCKPVICDAHGVSRAFISLSEASAATGVSISCISRACLGRTKRKQNGLTFSFIVASKG